MSVEPASKLEEGAEQTPAHYLNELYGESDDDEHQPTSDIESDFDEYDELEVKVDPSYFSLTLPEHYQDNSRPDSHQYRSRSRSRSPLNANIPRPSEDQDIETYVIVVEQNDEAPPSESSAAEEFYDPDVHASFTSDHVDSRRIRGRVCTPRGSARGRGRGRRRPGQALRGGRRREPGDQQWVAGDPLHEIWTSDNDVPTELKQMARDVMRRRQRVSENLFERSRVNEENECKGEDYEFYQDASGGRVVPLEDADLHFEWTDTPFQPKEEKFLPQCTGAVEFHSTAYDAFRSFWDDGILEHIASETNRYASSISSPNFKTHWYPTNAHEVLCLFAFWMMLGIIRMPTIQSCFSQNQLLRTDVFRRIFSRDRYRYLMRAIHFVDSDSKVPSANPTNDPSASLDRIYQLRPILDHLDAKFRANYIPSKDVSVDESLAYWKGNIKQYVQSKASKYGIRIFELCESATGYLWSFIVYTGKQNSVDVDVSSDSTSTAVFRKLIGPLLNQGYRLFMGNWFSSPLLARFLKRNRTDCVGALHTYHENVPYLVTHAPLERGQLIARNSGDVCVMAWQDRKRVTMMSTCHGTATALTNLYPNSNRPPHHKPQVVLDYARSVGGVDLKDQMMQPYLVERKRGSKWCMDLFNRLLNCSILNARILLECSLQHRQDHLAFRLQLVESILSNHLYLIPDKSARNSRSPRTDTTFGVVVNSSHWPAYINPGETHKNRKHRKRCVVCSREGRKDQKTPYFCAKCLVPLCAVYCFEKYHSAP